MKFLTRVVWDRFVVLRWLKVKYFLSFKNIDFR